MTTYTQFLLNGSERGEIYNLRVIKSISDNEVVSNFDANVENYAGMNKDFSVGGDVTICAGSYNSIGSYAGGYSG